MADVRRSDRDKYERVDEGVISEEEFDSGRYPQDVGYSSDSDSAHDFELLQDGLPKSWRQRISDWVYPPDLSPEVQLWRLENIAIPLSYLMVGTFQGLSSGVMTVYPVELGATEAQQTTIKVMRGLPASFKVFFGFLSDTLPLLGYRRKGYMLIGWLIASLSMFLLILSGTPSIPLLSMLNLMFGLGFWFGDVMADSLVAEKAKLETEQHRGQLQSLCYACRFFMLMVSVAFATYAYEALSPQFMFWIMAITPIILMVPAILLMNEPRNIAIAGVKAQCQEIWGSITSRAVWQPMGFIYVYNLFQIGNGAWVQFLYTALAFTPSMINSLMVVSFVLLYLGIMSYKTFMLQWSWRLVYIFTTLLNAVFSLLQIVLIFGWNRTLGISDYLFALGDDAMAEFIAGIQFLPSTIMMVHLCPTGSEGASYAMFTTVNNTAQTVAAAISNMLLPIWDVTKEAFEAKNFVGMSNLTILTTALQTAGLLFVFLLPRGKNELMALNSTPRSNLGGVVFLVVIISGLVFSLSEFITSIFSSSSSSSDGT